MEDEEFIILLNVSFSEFFPALRHPDTRFWCLGFGRFRPKLSDEPQFSDLNFKSEKNWVISRMSVFSCSIIIRKNHNNNPLTYMPISMPYLNISTLHTSIPVGCIDPVWLKDFAKHKGQCSISYSSIKT